MAPDNHRIAEVRQHLARINVKAPPGVNQEELDTFVNLAKMDISDEDILAALNEHDKEHTHDEY